MDRQQGIYLKTSYLGPRKRKPKPFGNSAETFEEAFNELREWRKKNGGRFLSGLIIPCERYQIESDGKTYWMQSVSCFAPGERLSEEKLVELNS